RRPDVAFVSAARWPLGKRVPDLEAWEVVPDLAIEVISRSNTVVEIAGKIQEYFASGVRQVWVLVPSVAQVHVYDSPTCVKILARDATLDGGDLVPGFSLPLARLYAPAEPEV